MKKIQKPMISSIGPQEYRSVAHGLAIGSLALTTTLWSISRLTRPSYWLGAYAWNDSLTLVCPAISWPVISTLATLPESTHVMNSLNEITFSWPWNFVEKFQMSTPTTTSTT